MSYSSSDLILMVTNSRRKFTDDQRLEILHQADESGVTAVLREHRLSYSVFARWKQKFLQHAGTNKEAMREVNKTRSELKLLNEENLRLKKIIADQALQ
ncbi:MAG TPA: transposase, partial [Chitinophagaceae bacterium]|nr:transposase [Chitinophagaceae bacterium]